MVAPVYPCSSPTPGGHVPEHQPRPSARPGLRSRHAHLRLQPVGWIGCICSSMLSPKRAELGGLASPKQPSECGREGCWFLPRRQTWLHLGTPAVALLPWVTSLSISHAPVPSLGSGLATPPRVSGSGVGLAVPSRPRKARKGPHVGVQPPLCSIPSGREGCWLLNRRRNWLLL